MAKLEFVCEECEAVYDQEWLETLPKSEEGFFQCKCCWDEAGEERYTHTVFAVKVA